MRKAVMTIAGSDPGGGAGIQQDIKVFTCLGLYSCAAITALTVQNTQGVKAVEPVSPHIVAQQVEAVLEDIDLSGVKLGMMATEENVEAVASAFYKKGKCPVVADPVMRSKNGAVLLSDSAWKQYEEQLLPWVDFLTPNLQEASFILSMSIGSVEDMKKAARAICSMMERKRKSSLAPGVYLKGGHLESSDKSVDVFCYKDALELFSSDRIRNVHTHGTGCTLSSAFCGYLALGHEPFEAARLAKEFVTMAIKAGFPLGKGIGPVDPLIFLK
ncbi:MAG: bifunctional hydroxymethylpyrimidine kinase/phosphomethylpyrimidine kinase [Thermodesulfobacteria bacterium]|nr:bifunctional hydroxymethylpyrimidine kinase/phosphomethylpyrimidine kinase [Thermodesulfobacteriota bacterium]